jgi:hypothetical protein
MVAIITAQLRGPTSGRWREAAWLRASVTTW